MPRLDPHRRRLAPRIAIVAVGLTAALPAAASNQVDTSNPNKIVIKVPIDLVGGEDYIAKRWNTAIKRYWNDGPGLGRWKFCGKSVVFEPDIQPIAAGQKGRPDAHKIRMRLVPDGVNFISNVRYSGTFDADTTANGTWGSNVGDPTIAHEFGHLIGLDDEYTWTPFTDTDHNGRWNPGEPLNDDLNHNGTRDPGEPTEPIPGFEDSIMAQQSGGVVQRLIDEAMSRNGVPDCKEVWTGTMHMTVRAVISPGACVGTFDTDLRLVIRAGKVAGTAKVSRVAVNSCDKSTVARVGQTIAVTGKLTPSRLTLSFQSVWKGRLPRTGNTAAGPVTAQEPHPLGTIYLDGIVNVRCQTC